MYRFAKKQIIYVLALVFVALQLFLNRNQLRTGLINQTTTSNSVCTGQVCLTPTITRYKKEKVKVLYVVDGDTIIVDGNKKVRYIGINSSELKTQTTPDECFAREALDENKKLLENKQVYLEKDVSETDKYGRLLRYVWAGDVFVNDYLVRNGFAQIATYPPDVKYYYQLKQAEKEARDNNRGLWKSCTIISPSSPAKLHKE
jgi:micrococcal nuclease